MNNNNTKKTKEGRDPVVTAISLIVIGLQSLIIILGYVNRWDWLAYECAAMLIIPALIVLGYGIKAIVDADKIMNAAIKEKTANDEN